MSTSPTPGYRAEPVGSLLRPEYLKEAVQRFEAGALGADALAAAQDRAVREAIALQEECGLEVLTDGEMRRWSWSDPLTRGLTGFERQALSPVPFTREPGRAPVQPRLPAVAARLGHASNLALAEWRFLQALTSRPTKVTLPSLSYASVLWVPGVSERAYPTREEYLADALQLMRAQVAELVAAGVRYIQLDAPRYTHLVSEEGLANFRRLGIDPSRWLDEMVALDNALMADFPQVTFGLHLCRGNSRSMWSVEGGYDPIAERLFTMIRAQRLLLEYDTPRAGTFAPLRFVPRDKVVVLGLITTKEPQVEEAAAVRRRVEEAARYIPLERLALSPQCGFASTLPGNVITAAAQRAKLVLVSQVAREVWG
ncbi:MAG TPA: methionine synthase [Chloroflexota bacterium]|nr:methionine synthase [Chloroflexota bacterium]